MTKKERVKKMLWGVPFDYLPSQLDFVPQRLKKLLDKKSMTADEFADWACNHFFYVFPLTESCYYSSGSEEDEKLISLAVEKGLIDPHPDNNLIYDNFHVSWLKNVDGDGIRDIKNPLKDQDIDTYQWPDPNVPGIFDHILDDLARHSNEYYVVGLQHLTFFERSYLLLGYQNFMMKLVTDLEFVEELMDRILQFHMGFAKRFIELGVDAVRTGDDWGMQNGLQIDPNLWSRLIKPRIAKIWALYKDAGITVMHHSCGDIELIIPDLIEIGLEVLHPVQPLAMSIETLAEKFGNKLTFHGGIDTQKLLPFGKPEEVILAIERLVETLGKNHRCIIAPSQQIMNDVPTENIYALVEGIKKYRSLN